MEGIPPDARDSRRQLGNTRNDLLREAAEGVTKAFRAAGERKPGTLPSQRPSPPKATAASGGGGAFAKTREILAKKRRGSFQRLYEVDDAPLYSHEQGVEPSQRSPPPPGTEAAILKDSRHRLPDTEDPPEGVGPEGTIEDARVEEEEVSMLAQARAELEHAVLEKRRQISDMVNDVESLSQLKDVQAQILQDREHLQELQQAADTDIEDVDFESQLIRLRHRIQQLEGERAELIDARAQAERAREYSNEVFASQGVSALNTEHLKAETFEENAYAYDQLARENTHLLEQQEALAQALETQEAYIGQLREFEESVKAMEEATLRKGQLGLVELAGNLGRAPVGVALLDLVGRKVGLRSRAVSGRVGGAEMLVVLRGASKAAVDQVVAQVVVYAVAQGVVTGKVDVDGRHTGVQLFHVAVSQGLLVAAQFFDKVSVARGGQANQFDGRVAFQAERGAVGGFAGGAGEDPRLPRGDVRGVRGAQGPDLRETQLHARSLLPRPHRSVLRLPEGRGAWNDQRGGRAQAPGGRRPLLARDCVRQGGRRAPEVRLHDRPRGHLPGDGQGRVRPEGTNGLRRGSLNSGMMVPA